MGGAHPMGSDPMQWRGLGSKSYKVKMEGEVGLWEWQVRTDTMGSDPMEWRGGGGLQ